MREESIPTEKRKREKIKKKRKAWSGKHFPQLGVINKNKCKDDFKLIL